jgi:hypothetical protein
MSGFTMAGTVPARVAASAEELLSLELSLARTAGSAKFASRARALGYTDEQIAAVIGRIQGYGASGQLGYSATGGFAGENLLLIGRRGIFTTASRARHELAHVLDEIANPGLMARSANPSNLGFAGFLRAEISAYRIQSGLYNPAAFWAGGLTASSSRFGTAGAALYVGGTAAAGYGTYRIGVKPLFNRLDQFLINR